MARQIEAYKLRTELAVDASKGSAAIKSFQKEVDNTGSSVKKLGTEIDKAGEKSGKRFGDRFGAAATTAITGSIDSLGQTIGSIIGTVINPGLGTAIGSTVGSAIDKMGAAFTPMIKQGLELNKVLEQTQLEFTTFAGSASEAKKYLDDLKKMAVETGTDPKFLIETNERLFDLTDNLKLSTTLLKAATDQAADFGGSAEVITKVADSLGLVAEKGELAQRDLKGLFKLGIDAKQYLAEATGKSEKEIAKLIAAGRIRGDVASRLIAEGIERKKGGYAAVVAGQTLGGAQARFGARMQVTEAEGTEKLASGLKDMYNTADKVLSSATAQQLVQFLNSTTGQLIDFAEKGIRGGLDLAHGVAEGITSNDSLQAVNVAVGDFGLYLEKSFKSYLGIQSPSQLMIDKVGIPLGEGIADGIGQGFIASFGVTKEQIAATLESLLKDPRVINFLELISQSETGKSRTQATGRLFGPLGSTDPSKFFSATGGWPGMRVFSPTLKKEVYTSPLGGGQIVSSTAKDFSRQTGLNVRMDQHGQDMIMTWLISRTPGALEKIKSGDLAGAMKALGGTWESFETYNKPGSAHGSKLVSQFSGGAGAGAGPTPVVITDNRGNEIQFYQNIIAAQTATALALGGRQDIQGGAKAIFHAPQVSEAAVDVGTFVQTINDSVPVIVDAQKAQEELIGVDVQRQNQLARMSEVTLKSLSPLEAQTLAENERTKNAIKITKESQKANAEQLIRSQDILGMLGGAVGQVAGMMPQQTVGKKRGLFSKILGIAAPFLNFIPGVGPILSTIAGAASAGIGGNWGGMVSSIAGGLASGGAFNPLRDDKHVDSGLISTANPASVMATSIDLKPLIPRAGGGPVYRGTRYIVGEARAETFTPTENGYITANGALAGGAGGGGGGFAAAAAELRAAVQHLNSMPAHHVVMRGAHGLVRAMDADAGLIRLVSQRQRLA